MRPDQMGSPMGNFNPQMGPAGYPNHMGFMAPNMPPSNFRNDFAQFSQNIYYVLKYYIIYIT